MHRKALAVGQLFSEFRPDGQHQTYAAWPIWPDRRRDKVKFNFRSGRLDPSYATLARKTGLGRSTIAVALARLKELGVITWLRRCTEATDAQGRFMLRQETNAYAVLPPSQWHGFTPPPEMPEPS